MNVDPVDQVRRDEAMPLTARCLARWESNRPYPCVLPKGHQGPHMHPMDYVPKERGAEE